MKMAAFWDIAPCSLVEVYRRFIALIEIASTSETSVNFYQTTWRNIPEDSHHLNKRSILILSSLLRQGLPSEVVFLTCKKLEDIVSGFVYV
jgi:hypothetical protein